MNRPSTVKCTQTKRKRQNSRRFSNRSWTYWSESEKDAKDCADANESTQTKSESESDVAFAWSALTLRVISTYVSVHKNENYDQVIVRSQKKKATFKWCENYDR